MKNIAEKVFLGSDLEEGYKTIHLFFLECQKKVKENNQAQIGSIRLGIETVDPLIVLEWVNGANKSYFYFEDPQNDFAIAGTEAILEGVFEGKRRFEAVRDFAQKWMENSLIHCNSNSNEGKDIRNKGPYFFTSFTFDERAKNSENSLIEKRVFPAACVFLSGWQIVRKGSQSSIIANVVIDFETNVELMAQEVWKAYCQIVLCAGNNNCNLLHRKSTNRTNQQLRSKEVGSKHWYEKAIERVLESIQQGSIKKVVIARAIDIESDKCFDPLSIVNRLRTVYPLCYTCLIGNSKGQNFICATPERLVKIENQKMVTDALAGTIARGDSEADDEALGNALLMSDKDLYEHQCVVDSITKSLSLSGIKARYKNKPELKKLANVQHLWTRIEADLESLHLLDIAALLHPTAAVCGIPSDVTKELIKEIEPFDRELYAGVIGFFDRQGEGELIVGIRSALINGSNVRLYAGGGIVKGSNFQNEYEETDLKFEAMLRNLL